jgi:CAAX prenyl protease-like protein
VLPKRTEGTHLFRWIAWRNSAVIHLAILVSVEIVLVWLCFEPLLASVIDSSVKLLETYGKHTLSRILLFLITAILFLCSALQSHFVRHFAEYRNVRLSRLLCTIQISLCAALAGHLHAVSVKTTDASLITFRDGLVGGGLVALWLAASLAAIVPKQFRFEFIKRLIAASLVGAPVAWVAWRTGELTKGFWKVTGGSTVYLVQLCLQPFAGGPVVRPAEFVIGTREFLVEIAPACGGFQGIGLISVLLIVYLWLFRHSYRFPAALLLLPIGIVLIWLANVVRITTLILVGIWISPRIAVDGFHSQAGWIVFLVVGIGIIWLTSGLRFFVKLEPVTQPSDAPSEAALGANVLGFTEQPYEAPGGVAIHEQPTCGLLETAGNPRAAILLAPFLALTATTILTRAFTSGFDVLYPCRVLAVAGVLWYFRSEIHLGECQLSLRSIGIGLVAFVLWMCLASGDLWRLVQPAAISDPLPLQQPWVTLWLVFRVVGAVVTVPIAEELAFRGFLTRRIIREDVDSVPIGQFSWLSMLLSSVAFGALHGQSWFAAVLVGILFASALYVRRRLIDAVVAHATTNALLTAYVLATGQWEAWG